MNKEQFYETYVKECIIRTFAEWHVLHSGEDLEYMKNIVENKPIMTLAEIEGASDMMKFAMTNVVYFNKVKYRAERYSITGIISNLNGGRIIVTAYDVQI